MDSAEVKTVLVIEDDRNTADLVALYLKREGFRTLVAVDGESGLALAHKHQPQLVILDLMLPMLDGWEVCRRLRERSNVPVIMLTARGEEIDRVAGLTLGADDYVVKPFSPRELTARVMAVLRRTLMTETDIETGNTFSHGGLLLETHKRRLSMDGRPIPLTPHEYALLVTLIRAPGRIYTRSELLGRLYPQGEASVIERVVDVHIGKLRQKIESNPSDPQFILTERGIGYRFADRPAGD